MLTTQEPPRSTDSYESHHTENLDVEKYSPNRIVTLPDNTGLEVKIDLNDYDPIEPDMLSRRDSLTESPGSVPNKSSIRRSSSLTLGENITESQLMLLTEERVTDLQQQIEELQKQLKIAEKTKELVQNPVCRKRMVGMLNGRRTDELGRQRLELARRIRGLMGDTLIDL